MTEGEKILYKLGYYDSDPNKKAEIQDYIKEADEFMLGSGVPREKLTTQRAHVIRSIWADGRDRGDENNIIRKDGMIVALLSQLKRG